MEIKKINEELVSDIVADTKETMVTKEESERQKYLSILEDLSEDIPEREPLLTQDSTGKALLYRGGVHVAKGKPKVGKTFYTSLLMTALTNPEGYCGLTPSASDLKVLYLDTEQHRGDVRSVAKRVHELNGWDLKENHPNFKFASLRGCGIDQRVSIIENLLEILMPNVIVIDGAVDLCNNFNAPDESHAIVTLLDNWATKNDVAIITVLHENKSDKNMRGHLGTILTQKAESVIEISKHDGAEITINCRLSETRHKPIDNFAFKIEESSLTGNALPMPCEQGALSVSKKSSIDYQGIFEAVLTEIMTHTNLRDAVVKHTRKSESTAKNYIDYAVKNNIIVKMEDGGYQMY